MTCHHHGEGRLLFSRRVGRRQRETHGPGSTATPSEPRAPCQHHWRHRKYDFETFALPFNGLSPSPTTLGSPAAHHHLAPSTHYRNLLGPVVVHALLLGSAVAHSVAAQVLADVVRLPDFDCPTQSVAAQVLPTHSRSATSHPTAHSSLRPESASPTRLLQELRERR
jgi:hypothetical protein